jgi:hypothetical protein
VERYGLEWLKRPVVVIVLVMAVLGLVRPLLQDVRAEGGVRKMLTNFGAPRFHFQSLLGVFFLCFIGVMLFQAMSWNFDARIVPMTVSIAALAACALGIFNETFRRPVSAVSLAQGAASDGEGKPSPVDRRIHMDIESDTAHVPPKIIVLRAFIFFGWLVAFMASMATIGLIPTVPLFVIGFMRLENREPWTLVLPQAIIMTVFIYVVFDKLLTIPWPQTVIGSWLPVLKVIPSV